MADAGPSSERLATAASAAPSSGAAGRAADGAEAAPSVQALPMAVLQAAAAGDQRAWAELVGVYGRRVYALVRSRLRRPELAEEITQSVFATIASKLTAGQYDEQGRFEAWLFRIAVNRIRDEIRRQRRQTETVDSEMLSDVAQRPAEAASGNRAAIESLRLAMARLPDADREVVELRHHAGLTFAQMADMLSEPLGTLLARHHRALKKLKSILAGQGVDELSPDEHDSEYDDDGEGPDAMKRGSR